MVGRAPARFLAGVLPLALLLIGALAGGCGQAEDPDDIVATATWTVTARALRFDTRTIVVPEGSEVVIRFRNEHRGFTHNISIYRERSGGDPVFAGELTEGVEEVEYRFAAPEPGEYFFRCDPHPDRMRGRFIVRADPAGE